LTTGYKQSNQTILIKNSSKFAGYGSKRLLKEFTAKECKKTTVIDI